MGGTYILGPISDKNLGTTTNNWSGGSDDHFHQQHSTEDPDTNGGTFVGGNYYETVTDTEANSGTQSWKLMGLVYGNPGTSSPHTPSLGLPTDTGPGTTFTLEFYFKSKEAQADASFATFKIYQGTYAGNDRTGFNINIQNNADNAKGLNIITYGYDNNGSFPITTLAEGLSRSDWHKVKVVYTIDSGGVPTADTAVYTINDGTGISVNPWSNQWRVANDYTQAYGDNVAFGGGAQATTSGFYFDDIIYSSDYDDGNGTVYSMSIDFEPAGGGTSCFTSDAIVATDQGDVPIGKITTKNTIDQKEIKGISETIYTQDQIVVIEKGAFGKNKPSQKTKVAPYHRFMINGKLQMIKKFVNGETIYYKKYRGETLYNIILETHDTMCINNMTVDTLHPNCLIAQLFNGTLTKEKRKQLAVSIEKHHKNIRKNKSNIKEHMYFV